MGTLTVKGIKAMMKPGRYADGDTLDLTVWPGGSKSWVQRLTIKGCRWAFANRVLIEDDGDPLEARRAAA